MGIVLIRVFELSEFLGSASRSSRRSSRYDSVLVLLHGIGDTMHGWLPYALRRAQKTPRLKVRREQLGLWVRPNRAITKLQSKTGKTY